MRWLQSAGDWLQVGKEAVLALGVPDVWAGGQRGLAGGSEGAEDVVHVYVNDDFIFRSH